LVKRITELPRYRVLRILVLIALAVSLLASANAQADSSIQIAMSSPLPTGADGKFYGGPNEGGHQGPNWYNQFGMDLGAPDGTNVVAAFDGHVTKVDVTTAEKRSGHQYGTGVFVRSENDQVGAYYTHLKNVPTEIAKGRTVHRGDLIGQVIDADGNPHLHMALVEITGDPQARAAGNGRYMGVTTLYKFFQGNINTDTATAVTFYQDGSTQPQAG
jgi:murein DD-endopeptidase MepM/ murein hydrolase activator NlpD